MATIIKHLGLNRKLREGGRYGIPSSLIKNAHISDIDDLRAYMDLYMGKEDKKTWEYIYNLSGNVDSTQTGVTGEGIDYAAFTTGAVQNPHFPMRGRGTYKTFQTQYAYTAPDGSVFFYCECQKCGWKKNLTARELINLNHTCENIEGSET